MLPSVVSDEPCIVRAKIPVAVERRHSKRRRMVFPPKKFLSDAGHLLTARQVDFGKAMERWKREHRNPFPTFADVLDVIDGMGYRLRAAAQVEG